MTDDDGILALPDILTTCACPHKPHQHLSSCQIAIDWDKLPWEQRYGVIPAPGQRGAGISYQHPQSLHGRLDIDVHVDLEALIKSNPAPYRMFRMYNADKPEYRGAELPMVWVWEEITDSWSGFGYGRGHLSADHSDFDFGSESGWGTEDTERLHAWLDQPESDPNQVQLDLGPRFTPQPCTVTAFVALEADGGTIEARCTRVGDHTEHNIQFRWPNNPEAT